MSELENPEFWAGVAFCLVAVIAVYPLSLKLKGWGKGQAQTIKKELDEAHDVRKQAEELYAKYVDNTKNLEQEKAKIMQKAEKEVIELQQAADEALSQKLDRKKKDVKARIELIQKNTQQDLTNQLMTQVVAQTKEILLQQKSAVTEKDMDKELKKALQILNQTLN